MNNFDNAQFQYENMMPTQDTKACFMEWYGDQFENETELDKAWIRAQEFNDERYY